MKKRPGVRSAGIVLAATLLVVCLLVAAVLISIRGGTRDGITLPENTGTGEPEKTPSAEEDLFLEVDRENVQAVLATMARPSAYHQELTVTNLWDNGSAETKVELWCSGSLIRAQRTGNGQVENLLTDGATVWIWYDGDTKARALSPEESVSFDDLVGIPTYETLSSIPVSAILEAGFVTLDQGDGLNCLYLSVTDGTYEDRYWVDTGNQLICRADTLLDDVQTYQLRQVSCQTLSPEDTALQNAFRLPDGTAVTEPTAE